MSIELVQQEALQLKDPELTEKLGLVQQGVWSEHFAAKPFGFLFYQVDLLMRRLIQEQAVVCVRNVKPIFTAFFKSNGERFEPIKVHDSEIKVTVIEGATSLTKEQLVDTITTIGLKRLVLHLAAKEGQFGPQSSAAECTDRRVVEAREENIDVGDFIIDHVYVQTTRRL